MAHGSSFKELAQKDAMFSENLKKAVNINSVVSAKRPKEFAEFIDYRC